MKNPIQQAFIQNVYSVQTSMQRAGGNAKMLREKEKVLPSEMRMATGYRSGREVIHTIQADQAHHLKTETDI